MVWSEWALPVVWAQAAAQPAAPGPSPSALAPLALRRWCGSQTLCSPETVPSHFGLWVWLAGLGALLLLAMVAQGPGQALRQLFDVRGLAGLSAAAVRRLRRSGRLLSVAIGMTVLSWTGYQAVSYSRAEGRDDLLLLTRSRGLAELAAEQGVFAALTPLRDVCALGSNLALLVAASLVVFRVSADLWGGPPVPGKRRRRPSGWGTLGWCCGAAFLTYRVISIGSGYPELPLGGCLMVEAVIVPALMAVCDGMLLGWVLVELRNAGVEHPDGGVFDPHDAIALLPGTIFACLASLPARYLAVMVILTSYYFPNSASLAPLFAAARWLLSRGLADVQGAALLGAGLAGAAVWGGGLGGLLRGYGRMLRTHGGRVACVLALAGVAAGVASAVAYFVVLSLPAGTWVLNAADSYAHYLTLPVGLWTLAALVELGERSLPEAELIPVAEPALTAESRPR